MRLIREARGKSQSWRRCVTKSLILTRMFLWGILRRQLRLRSVPCRSIQQLYRCRVECVEF